MSESKEAYYEIVGRHIQSFILKKWKSQKKAALILDVPAPRISEYITGERTPPPKVMLALNKYGFDPLPFEKWLGVKDLEPDILTKKELLKMIAEQRVFIEEQSRLIRFLSDRLDRPPVY